MLGGRFAAKVQSRFVWSVHVGLYSRPLRVVAAMGCFGLFSQCVRLAVHGWQCE